MTIYLSPEVKYDYHCTTRETCDDPLSGSGCLLCRILLKLEEKLENSKVSFIPQS
jgi:hypothetical protein